jgi:membrane fusion protein, protease secretion system
LAKEGYFPRNRWFDEERIAAELTGAVGELTANISRTQGGIGELEIRKMQRRREFMRDVEAQLADVQRDALVAGERMRAASEELARTEIRAPADGMVIGLAAHTVGGVIAPGSRIMDVVPLDSALTLDVHVEPGLIDKVHAGLPADIRIHAFLDNPNLMLDGRVLSVSADLMTPDQPNMPPYYLARVAITPEGMKELGNHQLQPGMQVNVVVKTGERTLLKYLLKPLVQRVSASLTEP